MSKIDEIIEYLREVDENNKVRKITGKFLIEINYTQGTIGDVYNNHRKKL